MGNGAFQNAPFWNAPFANGRFPNGDYSCLWAWWNKKMLRTIVVTWTSKSLFRQACLPVNLYVSLFIWTEKNLSTNSSWDFDGVVDTMDPYWFVPDEHFSPLTSGSRCYCDSLQQLFQKVLKMKNRQHFQAKKLLLPTENDTQLDILLMYSVSGRFGMAWSIIHIPWI